MQLVDFGFEGDLEVPAGEVRLAAVNTGVEPHNIGIRGGAISNEVLPGASVEVDIGDLAPGTYELYCDIPGHEDLGMIAPFVVTAPVRGMTALVALVSMPVLLVQYLGILPGMAVAGAEAERERRGHGS